MYNALSFGDLIGFGISFTIWLFWYRFIHHFGWYEIFVSIFGGVSWAYSIPQELLTAAHPNAFKMIGYAILSALWFWLYFKRRPPKKRKKSRIKAKIMELVPGRLVVVPT